MMLFFHSRLFGEVSCSPVRVRENITTLTETGWPVFEDTTLSRELCLTQNSWFQPIVWRWPRDQQYWWENGRVLVLRTHSRVESHS